MSKLRVLILEDNPADAGLLVCELQKSGFKPEWQVVHTQEEYLAHLTPKLDVILADNMLPGFDIAQALHILQERRLDIPFIVVSGSISEEVIVESIKQGATDYLLKDRLARLGQAVQRAMAERQLLKDKERMESALKEGWRQTRELRRFVSPPTVALVQARKPLHYGRGELRDFALLFSDMRRFTDVAHFLTPEGAFRLLSQSLEAQVETVLKHGGYVDKIHGDGFLAYFDGETRVADALRAAVEVRSIVQTIKPKDLIPVLPVGLAVHVGQVLFGMLGTEERIDHTVAGDVVNVCARLCGYAQPFQIVVTEDVLKATAHLPDFCFKPLGPVSIKGKPDPLPIYEVATQDRRGMSVEDR